VSGPNTEQAGGTRYSTGKAPLVHAPLLGMLEVGRVAEYGAGKYAPRDWQCGQSFSTLLNCALRHLFRAALSPQSRDPESGLLHAGHAAWNLLALLHFIETGRADELDDVTPHIGVTATERKARAAEQE
jgi:hypothetical protein